MDQAYTKANSSGAALLNDSEHNKGTAFTMDERHAYGLKGLLPHAVETLDQQFERAMGQLDRQPDDLARYNYLTALQDRNEVLFFRAVMSNPKRFLPIVYDPTVADARAMGADAKTCMGRTPRAATRATQRLAACLDLDR